MKDRLPPGDSHVPQAVGVEEEYLSHVAHELRASLNTIMGWAELLRTRDFDEAGRVRAADTILRHSRQQLWLIADLMDTWRSLSGQLRLNVGPVDLRGLIETAAEAIRPAAALKSVRLDLNLTPLPGHMEGDGPRLKQAILALLANAVHFMTNPGTIEVRLVPSPGGAELTVRDTGLAVSPEALGNLFDRHKPKDAAHCSRRGELGVGLGLVRDVIDLHGGSIHVYSDGREGLTFTISLPFQAATQAAPPALVRPANGPVDSPLQGRLLGLTVLIVDDEPDAREVVTGILTHYGALVIPTASVAEAFAALSRQPVDVVVTDIAMPGEDGYDLIHRLRQMDPAGALPAAALTAFASEEDRRRTKEAGFQVHLAKPVDPRMLIETIETLGRRSMV